VFVFALILSTAGFIALVVRNRRLAELRDAALGRATVSEQGAFRSERLWAQIDPQPWSWPRDDGERQRVDLDVAGPESLIQLLPSISAAVGASRIREWFTAIADEATIRARQASVRELTDMVELREAFEVAARRLHFPATRVAAFIDWGRAADPAQPASRRAKARDAVLAAEAGARMTDAYAELIGLVCDTPFESPLLRELQEKLGRGSASRADVALHRLGRVAAWAEVRSSPMMHAVLQLLVAWDYQIVRAVERWRASFGPSLGAWFSALAEIECIAALAGLAYANPAWSFPELAPETPLRLRARGLGHPLLSDSGRVLNDVELGPPGTVLLISGSNMSGKSTLLRAIGLNALLARVGGPVCAEAMWCPPLRLQTSLRIQDSLAEGISYFMAEALRLREIVFAAEENTEDGAPLVLYLVDEILRGTNSEERAVASRFIVARLLKTSAIGAITTHDLGVFDVPAIAEQARHAHFAEQFVGEGEEKRLTFDYRLRPGPTTSSNALQLLSLIGLAEA
jgi:MutS-like protein